MKPPNQASKREKPEVIRHERQFFLPLDECQIDERIPEASRAKCQQLLQELLQHVIQTHKPNEISKP